MVSMIARDPNVYTEPQEFRPERFLNASGQLNDNAYPETHQLGHVTFGFGRRYVA